MSLASSSSPSSSRAPAFSSSARSRVKIVTSSARGRENIASENDGTAGRAVLGRGLDRHEAEIFDALVRLPPTLGAAIEPVTISPLWVRAR